ncbi:hypothetical protein [Leifsonia naganoensis]|uniref:IPT/TIG domain-containing protein n=1 Tax=Leifsonia naganoensis TaxID=150025 RepID=A0A853DXG6_9MICO|nr:hypothetical protein [Leifsonia naganoensis]NYK10905.1 hypothetical protein [Leifsonia naganoensis]
MSHRFAARIGIVAVAVGAVLGGLSLAAPANAAGAAITVDDAVYRAGSWGSGITVSGTGFAASADVTIEVTYNGTTPLGSTTTTTTAAGDFPSVTFSPATPPFAAGPADHYFVTATDTDGTASAPVELDVRWPAAILPNLLELTTDQFVNPSSGFAFTLSGFDPGERITGTAVYASTPVPGIADQTADSDGNLTTGYYYLAQGQAVAGPITFTFTGATSNLVLTATVSVTGPTVASAGGGTSPRFAVGDGIDPAAGQANAPTTHLPVVSG